MTKQSKILLGTALMGYGLGLLTCVLLVAFRADKLTFTREESLIKPVPTVALKDLTSVQRMAAEFWLTEGNGCHPELMTSGIVLCVREGSQHRGVPIQP